MTLLDSMTDAGFVTDPGRRLVQRSATPAEAIDALRSFDFDA